MSNLFAPFDFFFGESNPAKREVDRSSVNFSQYRCFAGVCIVSRTSQGQRVTFGRASSNGEIDAAKETRKRKVQTVHEKVGL